MFLQSLIHSQGTVLEHSESGFLIKYETSEIVNFKGIIFITYNNSQYHNKVNFVNNALCIEY